MHPATIKNNKEVSEISSTSSTAEGTSMTAVSPISNAMKKKIDQPWKSSKHSSDFSSTALPSTTPVNFCSIDLAHPQLG